MPSCVHDHVHAGNEEEPIFGIKRPCANARGLTKPPEFGPECILMGVHVGHSTQVNEQGVTVLHAEQHAVHGQTGRSVRRQITHSTVRNLGWPSPMKTEIDEFWR